MYICIHTIYISSFNLSYVMFWYFIFTSATMTKLYFLKDEKIWSLPISGQGSPRVIVNTPNAASFDYHYSQRKLYWVDEEQAKVSVRQFKL